MKKLVLLILLACIVGLGALSVWGSLRAKQEYRRLILAIAESPYTRVLDTSYERGWLQSRSRASVEIRGPLGESFQQWLVGLGREEVRGRVGIRMRQTIEHGYAPLVDWLTGGLEGTPTVGRVETHLELDEETQSEISAVFGRLPPISISTVIRASGVAESSVIVPAQRVQSKLGAQCVQIGIGMSGDDEMLLLVYGTIHFGPHTQILPRWGGIVNSLDTLSGLRYNLKATT